MGAFTWSSLRCGGLHLVIIEVVPVSAGCVDKKVDFISIKKDLRISSDCINFDLLRAEFSGGGGHASGPPRFQSFSIQINSHAWDIDTTQM